MAVEQAAEAAEAAGAEEEASLSREDEHDLAACDTAAACATHRKEYEALHGVVLYDERGRKNPACSDAHRDAAGTYARAAIQRDEAARVAAARAATIAAAAALPSAERAAVPMPCPSSFRDYWGEVDADLAAALWVLSQASAARERRAYGPRDADAAFVMINECCGGFGVSNGFRAALAARTRIPAGYWLSHDHGGGVAALTVRTHPAAINLLRERGTEASEATYACIALYRVAPASALAHCTISECEGAEGIAFKRSEAIEDAARRALLNDSPNAAMAALRTAIAAADAVTVTPVPVALKPTDGARKRTSVTQRTAPLAVDGPAEPAAPTEPAVQDGWVEVTQGRRGRARFPAAAR